MGELTCVKLQKMEHSEDSNSPNGGTQECSVTSGAVGLI